ncbi:MAG: phosphate ABC transporter permease subunit PstC [Thermincolia bacterium]
MKAVAELSKTPIQVPGLHIASRSHSHVLSEWIIEKALMMITVVGSILIFFVILFIFSNALPVFWASGLSFFTTGGWEQQFSDAWQATSSQVSYRFGALELILGTIYVTVGAMLLAVTLGLGCAVFLVELCPSWLRRPLESAIHLMAAIPPIIYGLVGFTVVVPMIKSLISDELALRMIKIASLDGTSLLAGSLVLGIMVTPTFVILATDALRMVPRKYKEAALALGISPWRMIVKIMVPVARRGIITGALLSAGTAVGEFVAMSLVAGGVVHLPNLAHGPVFFLEPVRPLAATIFVNSEVIGMPVLEAALFACAALILTISIIFSLLAQLSNGLSLTKGRS